MPASWAIDVILYGSPRSGSLDACLKRVLEKKGCPILLGHPLVVGLVETAGIGKGLGRATSSGVTHRDGTGYLVTVTSLAQAVVGPISGVTLA